MLLSDPLASPLLARPMLLSDPLASPLLARLGWTFAGLFGSSLVALLITVHVHVQRLAGSVLFKRWRTWLVIAPIFSAVVLAGPLAVAVFAALLAVQSSREYANLVDLRGSDRGMLLAAAVGLPLATLTLAYQQVLLVTIVLPLLASLPALLSQDIDTGPRRIARLTFGLWYLPINLALMVLIARDPHAGSGLLLALGLGVALSDIGAFTTGRLWGKRALAARLSPSKTLAGIAGNVLGAALGVTLLAPDQKWLVLIPVVAIGALWGDLLESLLKRAASAKDTGAWLPGFGGLLDRIDSLLVVLPLAFLIVQVLP